jgi:DNA-binding MarR family transcriptional regulator
MKDNAATGAPDALPKTRLRLWLRLLKLSSGIEAELRRQLRDNHNTTLPRFDVMSALSRHPDGLKMSELSGYLKVSNGNVTGIVDKLTEDGLVLRIPVPNDKRAQIAQLTLKGHEVFAGLAAQHETWIDGLLGTLDHDAALDMIALLDRALDEKEAQ